MNNKAQKGDTKNRVLKILVPILIVAVVWAIWFFKNDNKAPATTDSNPDFALHVTEELDLEQLKSYELPIMIDFGADSCIPCKEMAPILVKLNEDLREKAIIKFVDVWKYPKLADGYPISLIPTQVFFDKDGNPYIPANPQALQINMYSSRETNEHVFTTHEGGMTEEMILTVLKEMGLEE
ncbi:MAG: thioredoxin domain-containing protein [Dehalobacterium sp.]